MSTVIERDIVAENAVPIGVPDRRLDVPARIEWHAAHRPDAIAVSHGETSLSYGQLIRASDHLARLLVERGLGIGDRVAVAIPRGVELIVAILGVLKAGAVYVPLEMAYPAARVKHVLRDAAVSLVVTGDGSDAAVLAEIECLRVSLPHLLCGRRCSTVVARPANSLAYVIYTSGSTGLPKGVAVEHCALSTFASGISASVPCSERVRWLALTTIAFDISILELLISLSFGGEVVIASDEEVGDAAAVARLIRRVQPAVVQATPSFWGMLVDRDPDCLAHVTVLSGGEALSRDLARALMNHSQRVVNLYGPTEATVWASACNIQSQDVAADAPGTVALGRPLPGYSWYVLDENRENYRAARRATCSLQVPRWRAATGGNPN